MSIETFICYVNIHSYIYTFNIKNIDNFRVFLILEPESFGTREMREFLYT